MVKFWGPFGTPDGSRADFEDILRNFIDLDGRANFGGVATRADDAKVRVIVGRIGAGKTVYMQRLFTLHNSSNSVYADRPQQSVPQIDLVVRACQRSPKEILTEKWMQLWHRAILRSLTMHLLSSRHPRPRTPAIRPTPGCRTESLSHGHFGTRLVRPTNVGRPW